MSRICAPMARSDRLRGVRRGGSIRPAGCGQATREPTASSPADAARLATERKRPRRNSKNPSWDTVGSAVCRPEAVLHTGAAGPATRLRFAPRVRGDHQVLASARAPGVPATKACTTALSSSGRYRPRLPHDAPRVAVIARPPRPMVAPMLPRRPRRGGPRPRPRLSGRQAAATQRLAAEPAAFRRGDCAHPAANRLPRPQPAGRILRVGCGR
jgi:hypothetical protein